MSFPCPRCKDRRTQSLRMAHVCGTGYTRSTAMAIDCAPPGPMPYGFLIFWGFLFFIPVFALVIAELEPDQSSSQATGSMSAVVSMTASANPQKPNHKTSGSAVEIGPPRSEPGAGLSRKSSNSPPAAAHGITHLSEFLLLSIPIAVMVIGIIRAVHYNSKVLPIQLQEWNSLFVCRACGTRFVPR